MVVRLSFVVLVGLACMPSTTANAHLDSAGYVACAEPLGPAPGPTDDSFESIGIRNLCSIDVIGVICVREKISKDLYRYATPFNLPAGGEYWWTLFDKSAYTEFSTFTLSLIHI